MPIKEADPVYQLISAVRSIAKRISGNDPDVNIKKMKELIKQKLNK